DLRAVAWGGLSRGGCLMAVLPFPLQVSSLPYAPGPGSTCRHREYFNKRAQMCCSKCAPGFHVRSFCTNTSDTVCARCEDSTYTQLWNWVPECLSCNSRCSAGEWASGQEVRNCPRGPGWTSLFLLARALPWDHPWLFPASVAEEGRDRAWERVPDEPEQCVL
uniref:TNFR-Cys domain-containing protein n=1 Tax=Neovison vison TaxID=452646 RepID=A0A8C7EPE4_NEOVI